MRDAIAAACGAQVGTIETKAFPDGERYMRVDTDVDGCDVALVGGTISDEDTLELYDLACSIVKEGARRLSLVIPYFGYSTMERAVRPGEVVTAKTRARLLSAIPPGGEQNRVILFDLHSPGIPHYFEGSTRPVHVYGKPIVTRLARALGGDDFVLACTDAGRAKWVESLANDMGVPASFVFKRRIDERRTEISAVSAYVKDKVVVIYDDMIRTGGSLINAAAAYKAAGATRIAAIATHGVFPGDALARLRATGLFSAIVCTDSHVRARALADDFLRVEPCAEVLVTGLGDRR
jgi:ribose-phosphate pyrophosphokinase